MLSARLRAQSAAGVLLAALAVEFADELFDGTKSAAMPLIRHDLTLSYAQIGLLAAVPLIAGGLLELPVGVLSGSGRRRRRFILAGGLVFAAAILTAGLAGTFAALLAALTLFFPASGAFVSLTQSALLDSDAGRRPQQMARWTLAGSAGAVTGPLMLAAVLAVGGTWRLAFLVVAACSGVAWLAVASSGRAECGPDPGDADDAEPAWPGWRRAMTVVREAGALRWLLLVEASDLLLDVFSAFLALYLVVVARASAPVAALGVAVRLAAGLAGDVILLRLLEHRNGRRVLRASVWLTLVLFPAFLLAPGVWLKLALLAGVTLATAPWYPVLTAELFGSLPGRSGLAVSLSSAAGLAGGLGPLAIGLLAQQFGLGWAVTALCVVPVLMLAAPRADPAG
jgi:FSR family fosmidomycin resistance protein-like MFS transporter